MHGNVQYCWIETTIVTDISKKQMRLPFFANITNVTLNIIKIMYFSKKHCL